MVSRRPPTWSRPRSSRLPGLRWCSDRSGIRMPWDGTQMPTVCASGELHPRGILWSHVVTFDGRPTSDVDATDGITLAALASHYSSPDLTPVKVSPRVPLPD